MKLSIPILVLFLLSLLPGHAIAVDEPVIKTFCKLALTFESVDQLKQDLLVSAKREAVSELFGELLTASTAVDDFVVTSDQIRTSSIGFVRVEGNPSFYNGDSLAEVCVTIKGYATDEDRKQFEPVQLDKRHCVTDAKLTTSELKEFAREEVIIQALVDYEPKLKDKPRSELLRLMQRIDYLESDFVPDTETYCVRATGHIIPIEIIAFLDSDNPSAQILDNGAKQATTTSPKTIADSQPVAISSSPKEVQECADTIEFGQLMECSIDTTGDQQSHEFFADANDFISITVVRTEGSLDPFFSVYNSAGRAINFGNCERYDSQIARNSCRLSSADNYKIVISSKSTNKTGKYHLYVQRLNDPVDGIVLEFGQTAEGQLSFVAERNYYTFFADAGDNVEVTMVRTDGIMEPSFTILGESGDPINFGNCEDRDAKIAKDSCKMPSAGNYTIEINSNAAEKTGTYTLYIQRLNNPSNATVLEFGQTIDGELSSIAATNYYTFFADAGTNIEITVVRTDGTLEPNFAVLGESGDPINFGNCADSDSIMAKDSCPLSSAAIYTIQVNSKTADKTGNYTISLRKS